MRSIPILPDVRQERGHSVPLCLYAPGSTCQLALPIQANRSAARSLAIFSGRLVQNPSVILFPFSRSQDEPVELAKRAHKLLGVCMLCRVAPVKIFRDTANCPVVALFECGHWNPFWIAYPIPPEGIIGISGTRSLREDPERKERDNDD